jgi:DNA-binding SARP family transcriptional activator
VKPLTATSHSRATPATPATPSSSSRQLSIAVLGPLAIRGSTHGLQPKHAELVVALALAGPDGLSNEALRGILGPGEDHPKPPQALREIITRTRRRLGTTPGGGQYIIRDGTGRYVLDPGASLDWHDFRRLTADGRSSQLRDALSLVRGQPFDGTYYWWLETSFLHAIRDQITHAASQLSALELAAGNTAAAIGAAHTGLAADATAEYLWRALMRAEDAAGNSAGVHQAWHGCLAAIADIAPDGKPHPATTGLYQELTHLACERLPGGDGTPVAGRDHTAMPCDARRNGDTRENRSRARDRDNNAGARQRHVPGDRRGAGPPQPPTSWPPG